MWKNLSSRFGGGYGRMKALTPAMRQFADLKKKYSDSILFFRMGDFYETFWEDAKTASEELDIVLTSRSSDDKARIPMAGVPYHSVEPYIARLVKKGYKVAICEQLEDPRKVKGIVKRDVVRVITPGTAVDDYLLEGSSNNFLSAFVKDGKTVGLSFVDVSTGEFFATQFELDREGGRGRLRTELERFRPSEYIVPTILRDEFEGMVSNTSNGPKISQFDAPSLRGEKGAEEYLKKHFRVVSMEAFGLGEMALAVEASALALNYLYETQKTALDHINRITPYSSGKFMVLDATTLRNLEVLSNIRDGTSKNTLLDVLDKTRTPMGSRLLRKWLLQPLMNTKKINERLDAVEIMVNRTAMRHDLGDLLRSIGDPERLIGKVVYGNANPKELVALKNTLKLVPKIRELVKESIDASKGGALGSIGNDLVDMGTTVKFLEESISEEPPRNLKDGGVIREGFNTELDLLRTSSTEGRKWIAELERTERRNTGIKSLKVGYNQVFGYYIEVTKSHLSKVPAHYQRKQTLANAERFVTHELKEKEDVILGADEKIQELEQELYKEILGKVSTEVVHVQGIARALAELDSYLSFATIALSNDFVKPEVNDGDAITIKDGRHPMVESTVDAFVPNDSDLDNAGNQLIILTGPNMSGKSTYMRQTALIVLMAQMGSFVPAKQASIGTVDRIFTRVGAFDDLTSGQSTFMVEMLELANILNTSTSKSLVLMDEIGRGTSTFDGLSIAWAVAEYIHNIGRKGVKTLFATHYHQLTELESSLKRVKNSHVAVKEERDEIIFLRKVVPGATDKSYGIQVAKLAGIPKEVISRSKEILAEIEAQNIAIGDGAQEKPRKGRGRPRYTQVLLLGEQDDVPKKEILKEIEDLDVHKMTPLEAIHKLDELKKKLKEGKGKPEMEE
jgi:DNA mismatch repair protein MutS